MFIGHSGLALAAKQPVPRVSLGTLLLAANFLDLIWPLFLVLGIEQVAIRPGTTAVNPLDFLSYPISHSLLADAGWASLMAAFYWFRTGDPKASMWVGALVISHWLLDALSHIPDMPLYPGGPKVGLGLWNYPFLTLVVEGLIFSLGVGLYARKTRARDRTGVFAFWSLVLVLILLYLGALVGPPPDSVKTLETSAFSLWLVVLWGYWIDRHRDCVIPDLVAAPEARWIQDSGNPPCLPPG